MVTKGTVRLAVCGFAVAALVVASGLKTAQARPNYLKGFTDSYPEVKEATTKKCGVCHIGPPKVDESKWNDYGTAVAKGLGGKKKVMPAKDVQEALKKTEKEKSSTEGKTFGDLLKEGKLPGKE